MSQRSNVQNKYIEILSFINEDWRKSVEESVQGRLYELSKDAVLKKDICGAKLNSEREYYWFIGYAGKELNDKVS